MNISQIKAKVTAVLLGVIVGDQLGEQVESTPSPGIIHSFRPHSRYTDDTQQTLITLEHLLMWKDIKPMILALEYAANADLSRKYGGNAANTLKKIKAYPELWESAYKEFLPNGSYGNGAIMRISSIALFDLEASQETLTKHLRDCLASTHNCEEALQCATEYCLTLRDLFVTPEAKLTDQSLIQRIMDRNLNDRLTDKAKQIKAKILDSEDVNSYERLFRFINNDLVESNIRAVDTLALVIALLTYNLKYKQWNWASLLKITVSLGGDCDTNAAIMGSLIGAINSCTFLQADWIDGIEDKDHIRNRIKAFGTMLIEEGRIMAFS